MNMENIIAHVENQRETALFFMGMLWKGYGEADNAISLQLKSLLSKGFAHFPQRFHMHK